MQHNVDFIAETGESGEVVWVWRSDPGSPRARAIDDPARYAHELRTARFVGASPAAISEWFKSAAPRSRRG